MLSPLIDRKLVVTKLIKERCRLAERESERMQKSELVRDVQKSVSRNNEIYQLFPPRKAWCGMMDVAARKKLDAAGRNAKRLYYTYRKAQKANSQELWYVRLCAKADSIVRMVEKRDIMIGPPRVIPIEKDRKDSDCIVCRPVCSFPLEVKIIFSLLNRYLTHLFDPYFLNCSYAFRKPGPDRERLQHLDAVKAIRDYRLNHLNETLYVAECDMQKFYDTIDHRIVKQRFVHLLQRAKQEERITSGLAKVVKRWFFLYLNCFDFPKHVLSLNKRPSSDMIWRNIKRRDKPCRIKWISQREIKKHHLLKCKQGIGVPQGGPLSGIIANIMMHTVDQHVIGAKGDSDIFYGRFCDDMILIGTNKTQVNEVLSAYQRAVRKSSLFAHPDKTMSDKSPMRKFWEGKSRPTYQWAERGENAYPWITFVGFDINWCGDLRIRKSSFKKQIDKQHTVANEILSPYLRGMQPRYCAETIKATLMAKLVGMSVGRVKLWNFQDHNNAHSWMSAYSLLESNRWSVSQLKELDRHRQKVYHRVCKALDEIECPPNKKGSSDERHPRSDRFMHYGRPFSYYGQCLLYKAKNDK